MLDTWSALRTWQHSTLVCYLMSSNSHDLSKHRPNSCELKDNYKVIKYTITYSGLARVESSTELSLWSKLEGPLRQSSVQTVPNTSIVRAKTIVTFELSLFSKFGRITMLELGQQATADDNSKGCKGTKDNLHVKVSSNNLNA